MQYYRPQWLVVPRTRLLVRLLSTAVVIHTSRHLFVCFGGEYYLSGFYKWVKLSIMHGSVTGHRVSRIVFSYHGKGFYHRYLCLVTLLFTQVFVLCPLVELARGFVLCNHVIVT
jgi:hypothetical protein